MLRACTAFLMTIRARLTLAYSALLAVLIAIFGYSMFTLLHWAWHSQLEENMRAVAAEVAAILRANALAESQSQPAIRKQLARLPYFAFAVQVWDSEGKLLFSTDNIDYSAPFDPDHRSSRVEVVRDVHLADEGAHALVLTAPTYAQDGQYLASVQILSPLATLDAAADQLFQLMIAVGGAAVLLSALIGFVMARQFLQPIETINLTARQITAADDLSKRIPHKGPMDELGELTATFNTTLDRLERLFKDATALRGGRLA